MDSGTGGRLNVKLLGVQLGSGFPNLVSRYLGALCGLVVILGNSSLSILRISSEYELTLLNIF